MRIYFLDFPALQGSKNGIDLSLIYGLACGLEDGND
jgi:hypothetical protein